MALIVREGTGTRLFYKRRGAKDFKQLPIQITEAAINGINYPSLPTAHLLSSRSGPGEVGGQTFIQGSLGDPGMLVITGFFDPRSSLPRGELQLLIRFMKQSGFKTAATIRMRGFFTDYSFTIPLLATMASTHSVKLSGVVRFIPAKKVKTGAAAPD